MTKLQALFIKYWYIKQECSYRIIHEMYQKRYIPEKDWWVNPQMNKILMLKGPHGNQLKGRDLVNQAQLKLNEVWEIEL